MELKELLPAVIILAATIISVGLLITALSTIGTNSQTASLPDDDTFNVTRYNTNYSLSHTSIVSGSDVVTCDVSYSLTPVEMTGGSDYTLYLATGKLLFLGYTETATNENHSADWYTPVEVDNPYADGESFEVFSCANKSDVYELDIDYGMNSNNAFSTYSYPREIEDEAFTTILDKNVTLAHTIIAPGATFIVHYCGNETAFSNVTDYTAYHSAGKITALGTGTLANDTEYCVDYYWSRTSDGQQVCANYTYSNVGLNENCVINYSYAVSTIGQDELVTQGEEALAGFGDWFTIICIVVASVIVIGIVMKLKGRET